MLVADSSTLILLAKTGMLDIFLHELKGELIIPEAVERECTSNNEYFDAILIAHRIEKGKIKVSKITNRTMCEKLMEDFNIASGEAEALILTLEKKGLLLTDDKKAINASRILYLPFSTALDILIRMREKGVIDSDDANAILEKLAHYGRYSKEIISDAKERIEQV